ncbi:MAG: helix-turn-helix domain-containing protein [Candidatus Cyclonatronum sp.]|uniref:helix-turn-helix domain-containing protein n=1 Tax=Cyclonatronum sp. TaxID=3024185 RepID=UPI0025C3A5AA|nr:helix-turn-helix domain-containing protein [Cyclonatronum sp.]MCH8485931.1 helix-turn-helix domain-containing protein [Cyclonatronum sp.]
MAQLQDDLILIRQQLKLSADDIHDKTRLSTLIIRQIEDGSIFESDQNKTYIRSFVRTYARALGIRDEDMIEALDQMETGTYQGYLVQKYALGAGKTASAESRTQTGKPEQKPQASAPEAAPKRVTETRKTTDQSSAVPAQANSSRGTTNSGSPRKADTAAPPKQERTTDSRQSSDRAAEASAEKTTPQPTRIAAPSTLRGPRPSEVNWSDVSRGASRKNTVPVSAILIVALVVIALGAFGYWYFNSEDGFSGLFGSGTEETQRSAPSAQHESALLPSDTLDAPVAPDPGISVPALQTLPDTLSVVIYAATGNLEPFRVRADTFENRRPYWVEIGRGMRIQFINEIAVSGNLNRMLVLYNDRVITTFAETNAQGERIIRRSQFEQDPTLESFTEPGLPDGVAPPREIIDRPLF